MKAVRIDTVEQILGPGRPKLLTSSSERPEVGHGTCGLEGVDAPLLLPATSDIVLPPGRRRSPDPQVVRGAERGRAGRGWLGVGAGPGQGLGVHSQPARPTD
jgi:hypothetical protein